MQEIATLLDVLPSDALGLPADVAEQVDLLRRQTGRCKLYTDAEDEILRRKMLSFLVGFEEGRLPDPDDLRWAFVDRLGIRDARACRAEIDFLEEQIYHQEEEVDLSLLDGIVALTRYSRFSLFGFGGESDYKRMYSTNSGRLPSMKGMVYQGDGDTFLAIPKDFCCPISLDLMMDPVIVSTGQTYDRESITKWMEEGHTNCPSSGQVLTSKRVVPNRALRNLISQWCTVNGVTYDPPNGINSSDNAAVNAASKAAVEANKATVDLLVQQLDSGSDEAKAIAARELRLLAKTGRENRVYIAEIGAIPLLQRLLSSSDLVAQENAVTAILNLSIHDQNKSRVMDVEGCLTSIVGVLRHGLTVEASENAAATLFSLSVVHEYKKMIGNEEGALEELARILKNGTARGKKDAVTALFNLSTHPECCKRIVESRAAEALVEALSTEGVAEEAAGALALLSRQQEGAAAIALRFKGVASLVEQMRQGSPKGKENAVAALAEMCRTSDPKVVEIVAGTPALGGLIQTLLFTGTKRARRKAASLARSLQKHEATGTIAASGWAMEYALARSRSTRRNPSFRGNNDMSEVSVSAVPVSISVPVP